jgi:hypothetical protein
VANFETHTANILNDDRTAHKNMLDRAAYCVAAGGNVQWLQSSTPTLKGNTGNFVVGAVCHLTAVMFFPG